MARMGGDVYDDVVIVGRFAEGALKLICCNSLTASGRHDSHRCSVDEECRSLLDGDGLRRFHWSVCRSACIDSGLNLPDVSEVKLLEFFFSARRMVDILRNRFEYARDGVGCRNMALLVSINYAGYQRMHVLK